MTEKIKQMINKNEQTTEPIPASTEPIPKENQFSAEPMVDQGGCGSGCACGPEEPMIAEEVQQEENGGCGSGCGCGPDPSENSTTQESIQVGKINLTDAAIDKIRSLTSDSEHKGFGLKIDVLSGGCSGYMYDFKLEKSASENDLTVEQDNVNVFVNKQALPLVDGATIDYTDTLQDAGFKVKNPNAQSTCGCGSSFD